jgi:exoribonuclease-2
MSQPFGAPSDMVFIFARRQNNSAMAATANNFLGSLVAYLDGTKLRTGLVVREHGSRVALLEAAGREKTVERDLLLLRYSDRQADAHSLAAVLASIDQERARLASELDLHLLWEVIRDQGRTFSAAELSELFFGVRSTVATSVVLEALLSDRLYFNRRHMDFVAQNPEQVARVQSQHEKSRQKSEAYRHTLALARSIIELDGGAVARDSQLETFTANLTRFLENPHTRNRDLGNLLSQVAPDLLPAETAFEILDRLGARPAAPRFALIGGLRLDFSPATAHEAEQAIATERPLSDDSGAITIDDPDTLEIDDAISSEPLADGVLRVRIHIALVSDIVTKGGAIETEAAARAATFYLPEATIRMLPDVIACDRASLIAGVERPVLTTDLRLSAEGELLAASIYPSRLRVATRLDYDQTNRILSGGEIGVDPAVATSVRRLDAIATKLRDRRRRAGAIFVQRRESKIRVCGDQIDIQVTDAHSPARLMVAEFMVLSNFVAARHAADNRIPIIYRVQPLNNADGLIQRPRLSLYPEFHAGIGLSHYAQVSSPIRRYADLVMQRQLIAGSHSTAYSTDELIKVLAGAESVETEGRELERRAKRYWTLLHLERTCLDRPLDAIALRDGGSAELTAYAVRGTLRGLANAVHEQPIVVRIARVDPLRGWLAFDYLGPRDSVQPECVS